MVEEVRFEPTHSKKTDLQSAAPLQLRRSSMILTLSCYACLSTLEIDRLKMYSKIHHPLCAFRQFKCLRDVFYYNWIYTSTLPP